MFKQGDVVSYGATGVCRISGECIQKVKGENRRYLTLKPVYSSNSTVYVPIGNEVLLGKVKNLMTDEDAKALIQELPLSETDWIENDAKRKLHKDNRRRQQKGACRNGACSLCTQEGAAFKGEKAARIG